MSLINRLIREARLGATQLSIKPNDVRKVAEHCRACMMDAGSVDVIADLIRRGQIRMAGVPLKVLGVSKHLDRAD